MNDTICDTMLLVFYIFFSTHTVKIQCNFTKDNIIHPLFLNNPLKISKFKK